MSRERVYYFEQRLRSASTTDGRLEVLSEFQDILPLIEGIPSNSRWRDMKESGLLDLLVELLSQTASPLDDLTMFAEFIATGLSCLLNTSNTILLQDDDPSGYLLPKLPAICRATVSTLKRLENATSVPGDTILTIQVHAVQFLYPTIQCASSDHAIFEILDTEFALRIVLALVFHPLPERAGDWVGRRHQLLLESSLSTLAPFRSLKGPFVVPSIESIANRYGYEVLARRFAKLWTTLSPKGDHMTGLSTLVLALLQAPWTKIRKPLLDSGLYDAILQNFWRWRRNGGDMSTIEGFKDGYESLYFLERVIPRCEIDMSIRRVISGLLRHCDLVQYLGNLTLCYWVQLAEGRNEIQYGLDLDRWSRWIALACANNPALLNDCVLPNWSHVMASFQSLARGATVGQFTDAIQQWEKLYPLNAADLSLKDDVEHISVGCNWAKCLLHFLGEDHGANRRVPVTMLRCAHCREVQYCGDSCQKRDWKAGHRASCRHGVMTLRKT